MTTSWLLVISVHHVEENQMKRSCREIWKVRVDDRSQCAVCSLQQLQRAASLAALNLIEEQNITSANFPATSMAWRPLRMVSPDWLQLFFLKRVQCACTFGYYRACIANFATYSDG